MGGLEAALLRERRAMRRTAVLVAAMDAPQRQGEPAGPRTLARCLEVLGQAAEGAGGRVVRRRGGQLVALFPTPDLAAAAAACMHQEAQRLLPDAPAVRSGLHIGPVAQRGHEVAGDTISLAAELASRAGPGQILTPLGELPWRGLRALDAPFERGAALELTYRHVTRVRRREGDALTLGRNPDCDVCVDLRLASRRHCTIERRDGKLRLRDHSANGTFVTLEGGQEARIRDEEIVLNGRGWLSLGVSRLLAEELVRFRCE